MNHTEIGHCPQPEDFERVVADVLRRRKEQDAKHGGEAHDDTHYYGDWISFIKRFTAEAYAGAVRDRLGVAGNHSDLYESALIDIAALAIAAIQSHRRIKHRGRQ